MLVINDWKMCDRVGELELSECRINIDWIWMWKKCVRRGLSIILNDVFEIDKGIDVV